MTSVKFIGMDVHMQRSCVRNEVGKIVMECVIETKASTILQFIDGAARRFAHCLRGRNLGHLVVRPAEAPRDGSPRV